MVSWVSYVLLSVSVYLGWEGGGWACVRGNDFSLYKIGYRVWIMDALLAEVILDDIAKSIVVEVQGEKSMA